MINLTILKKHFSMWKKDGIAILGENNIDYIIDILGRTIAAERELEIAEKALELAVSDVAVDCRRCPVNYGDSCSVGSGTCNSAIKKFYVEKARGEE